MYQYVNMALHDIDDMQEFLFIIVTCPRLDFISTILVGPTHLLG